MSRYAALQRTATASVPDIVYVPNRRKILCDAPYRGQDPYVGYRALWMKVIIRAAFDWVSYRDSSKLDQRKEADKAFNWIFKPNIVFNSFENVCQLVDLPPDKMRHWVRGLTKEHVAKIEHLERESGMNQIVLMDAERRLVEGVGGDS